MRKAAENQLIEMLFSLFVLIGNIPPVRRHWICRQYWQTILFSSNTRSGLKLKPESVSIVSAASGGLIGCIFSGSLFATSPRSAAVTFSSWHLQPKSQGGQCVFSRGSRLSKIMPSYRWWLSRGTPHLNPDAAGNCLPEDKKSAARRKTDRRHCLISAEFSLQCAVAQHGTIFSGGLVLLSWPN